jgi:hypothetical protein
MRAHAIFLAITFHLLSASLFAQHSGSEYYRMGIMNGNNIKTVFGNWGVIGQPAGNYPRGAWLRNANGYIGDESIMVGLEFPIKDYNNDGIPDTVHSVITTPVSRPAVNQDEGPNGDRWTLMPTGISINGLGNSVAFRDRMETWPAHWSGWRPAFDAVVTPNAVETYIQMNDMNDHRFDSAANNPYNADFTGTNGQGISIEARYVQLQHPMFRDVMFRVYDIKNTSDLIYSKVFFGYLMGTFIGVTGNEASGQEYDDDYSILLKKEHIVISGDYDNDAGRNPFWTGPVGKVGNAYVDAPNSNAIGSFYCFAPSSTIPLANDEELWNRFRQGTNHPMPGVTNDTVVTSGMDADYTMGTEYFSLAAGEKKRISSVLAYGYTNDDIRAKVSLARVAYGKKLQMDSIGKTILWQRPSYYQSLQGEVLLQWSTSTSGGTVDIYFTSDRGHTYSAVVKDQPNSGSYQWNTNGVGNWSFGKFVIIHKGANEVPLDFSESGFFRINNSPAASPHVFFDADPFVEGSTIIQKSIPVSAYFGLPERDTIHVEALYSTGNDDVLFYTHWFMSDSLPQTMTLNLESIPNSSSMSIRFSFRSATGTSGFSTPMFNKQTPRYMLLDTNVSYPSLRTNAGISVVLLDKTIAGNDRYVVSFVDTAASGVKTFSVFNSTKSTAVVTHEPIKPHSESSLFNGMRLKVNDVVTMTDTLYWNNAPASMRQTVFSHDDLDVDNDGTIEHAYAHPCDYRIVFFDSIVDSTVGDNPRIPINYRVYNLSNNEQTKILSEYSESNLLKQIFIRETILGTPRFTWTATILLNGTSIQPGDTLTIKTRKGVSFYDTLIVFNVASGVNDIRQNIPSEYSLSQNYPNPFNPATTFAYQLPHRAFVTLKIYDAIGREAAVLVNEEKNAGSYTATWNAERFSSGLYFARMSTEKFSIVKKIMLVK